MSSSPDRRARLAMAKTFPQARCPDCGANLALIFNVGRHLTRCAKAAIAQRAAAP